MNLINTVTLEYPRSLWQLRQENPNVSFPTDPSDEDLAPFDHACVQPSPQPEHSPRTERLEEGVPAQQDGTWHQTWTVREATEAELADYNRAHAPAPEWREFAIALILLPETSEFISSLPAAPARALEVALAQVASGAGAELFSQLLQQLPLPSELGAAIGQLAGEHHLPAELFTAAEPAA